MEGEAGRCWGDNYKVRASLMAQTVENLLQCRRPRFDPWVWKISWRRKWLLTPIFLPREFQDKRAWWATVHGIIRVRYDSATNTSWYENAVWLDSFTCSCPFFPNIIY